MAGNALGLGRVFNVIASASGVHIPLQDAEAVTFVCEQAGIGAQILTIKESIAGASEQNLAVIDTVYKGPDVGGTWTKVTQTAAATYDNSDDTTNDTVVVTVQATELSDTFDSVECTVDVGNCVAIVHDLKVQRTPANLSSSV